MWTKLRHLLAFALAGIAVAVIVNAVTETSTETITYSVGPGDAPSTSVSATVTSTVTLQTQYTDTLSNARGWVDIDFNGSGVAMMFIQFDADSTSNIGLVRIISDDADTLDSYVNEVFRFYQPADSTTKITSFQVKNGHPDGYLTYHVVATGQ